MGETLFFLISRNNDQTRIHSKPQIVSEYSKHFLQVLGWDGEGICTFPGRNKKSLCSLDPAEDHRLLTPAGPQEGLAWGCVYTEAI